MAPSPDYQELLGAISAAVLAAPLIAWGTGYPSRKRARITSLAPPTAIDVTAAATDARRLARKTRATQAAGAVILAMGVLPFVWPVGLLLVPVGLAVAMGGTVYFRRRAMLPTVHTVTKNPLRRAAAVVLVLTSVILMLAALVGLTTAAAATQHQGSENLSPREGGTVSWGTLQGIGWVLGLGSLTLSIVAYRSGRRLARADARETMLADDRPLVLYLRSFADDAARIPAAPSPRRPLLETLSLRPTERFEEVVGGHLMSLGPVVAISDPDGPSHQLGAARVVMPRDTDEWKSQVTEWLHAARLVVVTAGTTEGLRWELEQVAKHGNGKSIFLFPPGPTPMLRTRGDHLLTTLAQAGVRGTQTIDVEATLAIAFGADSSLHAISADRRDEASYEEALAAGVGLLEGPADSGVRAGQASARRVDRLVVLGAAAVSLMCIVIAGLLAPASVGATELRQRAEESMVRGMVNGGETEQQAGCIAEGFLEGISDDELQRIDDEGTLSDSELDRFKEAAARCR